MKSSILVFSVLFSAATLVSNVSFADQNDAAAMSLCDCSNPANQDICSRLQQSNALERDPSRQGQSAQNHSGAPQRAPASMTPAARPAR